MNGNQPQGKSQSNPAGRGSGGGGQQAVRENPSHEKGTSGENLKEIKWFNPDHSINEDLFCGIAEKYARKLSDAKNKNELSQIRGFFDELIRIEMAIKNDATKFKEQLPFILLLRSKVYYAKGRDLVTDDFVYFMDQGFELSKKGIEEFKVFIKFFEAFMGYFKYSKEFKKRNFNN